MLVTRLGEVNEPVYRFQVEVPTVPKEVCAIQLDNMLLGDVQKKLGLTGAEQQLWPGKVRYVTSIIFQELSDEWVEWLTKQYGQTPHFALMVYSEYTGEELKDCKLVAEVYVRKPIKERKAKHLWSILEQALAGKYDYGLQAKHYNKCRVGLRSMADLELFRRTTLLEL